MNVPAVHLPFAARVFDEVARELGLATAALERVGPHAARVRSELVRTELPRARVRWVAVTASRSAPSASAVAAWIAGLLSGRGARAVCTIRSGRSSEVAGVHEADTRALRAARGMLATDAAGRATCVGEVRACLSLAHDPDDLRARLARAGAVSIGDTLAAMTVLRRASAPTLTLADGRAPALVDIGAPVWLFGGPSVVTDQVGVRCADYVITEAAAGIEAFVELKCRTTRMRPRCVVHAHAVEDGAWSLELAIRAARLHGLPIVCVLVAAGSAAAGLSRSAREAGAFDALVVAPTDLERDRTDAVALAVVGAADEPSSFRFLGARDQPLSRRLHELAVRVHGLHGVAGGEQSDRLEAAEAAAFGLRLSLPSLRSIAAPPGRSLVVQDVTEWPGAGVLRVRATIR